MKRKDPRDDAAGRRQRVPGGFLGVLRETMAGGAGLITPGEVPAGRAERLGLTEAA